MKKRSPLRRRHERLTELGRAATEAVTELVRRGLGDAARPGIVVSIATAEEGHPRRRSAREGLP